MLKLGTQTGSLTNHLYSRMTNGQPKPEVGMGCTFLRWTDRDAGTIWAVRELKSKRWQWEIEVSCDAAKMVSGSAMSEDQGYEFTPQPDARRVIYRCDRNTGEWVRMAENDVGRLVISRGSGLRIGQRDSYRDPSF
jgi:hypothetical protein